MKNPFKGIPHEAKLPVTHKGEVIGSLKLMLLARNIILNYSLKLNHSSLILDIIEIDDFYQCP